MGASAGSKVTQQLMGQRLLAWRLCNYGIAQKVGNGTPHLVPNFSVYDYLILHGQFVIALQWFYNEGYGVSNDRRLDCLLNFFVQAQIEETSKLRITGLCEGNSPVTGEFPEQRASDAENVSTWRRHHGPIMLVETRLALL